MSNHEDAGCIFGLLYELVFVVVCFYIGRPFVWLATLGHYPQGNPTPLQGFLTSCVGMAVLITVFVAIKIMIW